MNSFVTKYADDVKLYIPFYSDIVSSRAATSQLQDDLCRLHEWSLSNGLYLNFSKCKTLHFGHANPLITYHLDHSLIDSVSSVKDLGILVSSDCNFREHVCHISSKANRFLGIIKKSFSSRDICVLLVIYKSKVRPILEFGSIVWCPYREFLSDQIENVQKRFTRLFPHIRTLSYRERLQKLGLLSLCARRLRYKLIYLFKIMNNLIDIDPDKYFRLYSNLCMPTRGNPLKIVPLTSNRDCRRFFFTVDVVFHWNCLTKEEVSVRTVSLFKKSVSSYFRRSDIF